MAKAQPDVLVIGVDANGDNLRNASRRSRKKPSRGGLPNVLFGRLALEEAPGALAGFADRLTVLLPWGSLLAAVARPDLHALGRLAAVCRQDAQVRVIFGYTGETDPATTALKLLHLDEPRVLDHLRHDYSEAGFAVRARHVPVDEVCALPTSWAKKLAYSGKRRVFIEIVGRRQIASQHVPANARLAL
jgi:16S rRNA (adenine(1408)-N(1))-methyltransferase